MVGRVICDEEGENFEVTIDDITVCELNLWEESYDDDWRQAESVFWLNGIYTKHGHDRKGYATKLIEAAIEVHGKILISSASSMEHKDRGDTTARELTDEGAIFVKALVNKGIINPEWIVNPFR